MENGPKWSQNGAKIDFDHQKKMEEVEKKDEEQESERIKRRKRSKDQKWWGNWQKNWLKTTKIPQKWTKMEPKLTLITKNGRS